MRAEEVIVTHGNTDFDAFAAMLAARRLYPNAVVALAGSLNRNVREFYRLYADELDIVEASRLDLSAIRRLIVVETVDASRLGELEPVACDPNVEKVVFDHHPGEHPDWTTAESTVLSEDGALTTTLVGILAEREIPVTRVEATAFALGIHEDTGSLTYPTATQRDADALAWCLRHGARQDVIAEYLHKPLSDEERELLNALLDATAQVEEQGVPVLVSAVTRAGYVEGISNLAHKLVDLTDAKALVVLVEMDGRVFGVTRSRTPDLDAGALGGRVRAHPKFGTAVVLYGEDGRVDVVTARTEFYDAPAALPSVEHASIREDLFRRDFTINAMAVSLRGEDLGRLVDPFAGRRDLDAGRIRVLHNLSFIDDPTRIFRAVRYENRYGFRIEDHTVRLARGCIE